jgi:hypothetical protein
MLCEISSVRLTNPDVGVDAPPLVSAADVKHLQVP